MINDLQIFKNTEFGELKVLIKGGKYSFPATKCARMLGYAYPYDAIKRHTKRSVKHRVGVITGKKSAVQEVEV